jgi:hypothetical protein
MIWRIDPTDTPFMTGVDKVKATAVNHEWQTQALAGASGSNAQLEGDDITADAATPTVRLGNIAQISRKTAAVTGTQQAVDHAGRDDEMAYQEMLKGLELKRDMETILLQNQTKVTGDTTTARKLSSVLSWIKSNTSTSGTDPATSGSNSRTDGTQRVFTEAQLKTVLSSIWTNGGKPDTVMVGAFNKQQFSTFTGRASPIEETKSKKITASVDAYESDFGTIKVVANRFQRSRDALVLEMDKWAVAFLPGRKMVSIPLAIVGDARRKSVLSEYTLEARNEKASGGVFDLTTS